MPELTQQEINQAVRYALAYLNNVTKKFTDNPPNQPDVRRAYKKRLIEIDKEIEKYNTYLENINEQKEED